MIEAFKKTNLSGEELAVWKYQRYMKDYLRCVQSVDDNVGRLMAYLKENNLQDNTIVIYTSDQGFFLGEHGWFDKRWMYEESFRTLLIVKWPGVTNKKATTSMMVQNLDFAETILEMAGLPVPADMQGKSFVPLLRGNKKAIYMMLYTIIFMKTSNTKWQNMSEFEPTVIRSFTFMRTKSGRCMTC